MPSRKKAKGKARKASKEAKAKEEESRAVVEVAANQRQEESIEAMLQRLTICSHGCSSLSAGEKKIYEDFIKAYIDAFFSEQEVDLEKGLLTATDATVEVYGGIYDSKLDRVISMLLSEGTQCILDGNNVRAKLYASFACYFENFMACFRKTQAVFNWTKILELESADDHSLISYYRKRISCSCLDEKYKEVKSVKKMGFCFNPSCSLPERKVERCKMFSCTRCGEANYCSVECQRAAWKEHKEFCDSNVEKKAAFDSEQS